LCYLTTSALIIFDITLNLVGIFIDYFLTLITAGLPPSATRYPPMNSSQFLQTCFIDAGRTLVGATHHQAPRLYHSALVVTVKELSFMKFFTRLAFNMSNPDRTGIDMLKYSGKILLKVRMRI
jgi:hypothetical protein